MDVPDPLRELADRGHRILAGAEQPMAGVEAQPEDRGIGRPEQATHLGAVSTNVPMCGWNTVRIPVSSMTRLGDGVRPGGEHLPLLGGHAELRGDPTRVPGPDRVAVWVVAEDDDALGHPDPCQQIARRGPRPPRCARAR